MHSTRKLLSTLLVTALLAACGGDGISGTYQAADGSASVTFAAGQAVFASADHTETFKASYTVDGDKIMVHGPNGDAVFTRQPDGSLDTPWGRMKPKG